MAGSAPCARAVESPVWSTRDVLAGRAGSGMVVRRCGWSVRRHPVAYRRRIRNLSARPGLASLGLRQTLAGRAEPGYGQGLGDGMAAPPAGLAPRLVGPDRDH